MFLVEPVPAQKSKESSADVILNISGQVWLWMEKALTLWKAWKKNCYFQTLFLYDVGFSSSKMLAFSGCFLSFLWPTEIACQLPTMKSGITIEWIKKSKRSRLTLDQKGQWGCNYMENKGYVYRAFQLIF